MKTINIPPVIQQALESGATLAISISGGKDSQALLNALNRRKYNWPGPSFAIHAHLGRAEWPESLDHCARHACVTWLTEWERFTVKPWYGMDQLTGTDRPFWPSAKVRYCTSDLKTRPIDKYLRKTPDLVISAEGIRAKESPRRAKKNPDGE